MHTAGPFQQREDPALLRAALDARIPYVDVCDELELSRNAKALSERAARQDVPAVVSCGIWPGVSALMAAEAVEKLGGQGACERLEFSFFTAGTGGAGPTIVSATFLLLATKVARYIDGALVEEEPWLERRVRDFGEGVGEHECYTLDNPDVPTTAEALGIQDCVSRFGTYPSFWNNLFGGLKAVLELCNRQQAPAFRREDERELMPFCTLAGITLHNSRTLSVARSTQGHSARLERRNSMMGVKRKSVAGNDPALEAAKNDPLQAAKLATEGVEAVELGLLTQRKLRASVY